MTLADLTTTAWVLLVIAALLIGFSKTAIGGVAMISVAICAAVLPSRASTGIVLPMLIVGDIYAVRTYHRHADWRTLRRLLPSIVVGVVIGAIFISRVDDTIMRHTIGGVVLALVALHVITQWHARRQADEALREQGQRHAASRPLAWFFGGLTGFTTMVANAGGPAMSLYLLAARFSVLSFLGTMSWLFFVVNLIKVPFAVGLGLITAQSLVLNAILVPPVLLGAWFGKRVIARIPRATFENLVLVTTVASAVNLLR